jgi:hypothetical protein
MNNNNMINSENNQNFQQYEGNIGFMHPKKKTISDGFFSKTGTLSISEKKAKDDTKNLVDFLNGLQEDLIDYVRTHKGSRSLQKFLNKITTENLEIILSKLDNKISELMVDVYGNYLLQKLVVSCSPNQRIFILKNISPDFYFIACHNCGTHALQALIDVVNSPEEIDLIREAMKDYIYDLSIDNNGTHVIQKIFTKFDEDMRKHINYIILENLANLCNDANGISVIKKFVNGNKSEEIRDSIVDNIANHGVMIMQNAYGNYIIQHIFDAWGAEICRKVLKIVEDNITTLSTQKFSSNVVEKFLDVIDYKNKKTVVKDFFNNAKIFSVLRNKYGNFVLQKAVALLNPDDKAEIKEALNKKYTNGKEKTKFEEIMQIFK